MVTVAEFPDHVHKDIQGQFRILAVHDGWNHARNMPCVRIELADWTGAASVIAPPALLPTVRTLKRGDLVESTLRPRVLDRRFGGTLASIRTIAPSTVSNIAALMPAQLCPAAAVPALAQLVRLLQSVRNDDLREFVNVVLDRHHVDFLRAQAGWKYHHDYPGGLLVHSVDVAIESARTAKRIYAHGPDELIQLYLVGGLLHDFGKTLQLHRGRQQSVISSTPHEILTLQMLHTDLLTLSGRWPAGADLLNNIFIWLATSVERRRRGQPGELVHLADVTSVWSDRGRLGGGAVSVERAPYESVAAARV